MNPGLGDATAAGANFMQPGNLGGQLGMPQAAGAASGQDIAQLQQIYALLGQQAGTA
jgi:hypothetical protein